MEWGVSLTRIPEGLNSVENEAAISTNYIFKRKALKKKVLTTSPSWQWADTVG